MALDVRTKNGFLVISYDCIGKLDSYFIHRYIIIKYMSRLIKYKIHRILSRVMALDLLTKNGFRAISYMNTSVY